MDFEIIDVAKLDAGTRREISEFLDSQETAHPFQFPQWALANDAGQSCCCLWRDGAALAAFASCGVQRPAGTRVPLKALVINRGPVCDDMRRWREALNDLVSIGKDRKLTYIDAAPERAVSESETSPFPSPWKAIGDKRTSLRLDATRDEDEIFAGFRKVARYEVRRAERAGVSVARSSSGEESKAFLDLYLRLAKRKGFAPDAPKFVEGILGWLYAEPVRGGLFVASRDGAPVAGLVVARAGNRCWYVWGASEEHRDFSAGHLLQWNAIRWAKAQGCAEYDFGGYTPGAKSGPAWFKAGFGGKVVRLMAPHRIVLGETKYRLLQVVAKARSKLRTSGSSSEIVKMV